MIIRARAPLRLGLAGGGTDVSPYCDDCGGAVLNATINRYAYATLKPLDKFSIHSIDYNRSVSYELDEKFIYDGQMDLAFGVLDYFRKSGKIKDGIEIILHNDAPPGSGLGSSSAIVVALISALSKYCRLSMDNYQLAKLAYHIERVEIGQLGGRQDQYAAAFGGFNFMEFKAANKAVVHPLRIREDIVNELEYRLVFAYIRGTRFSAKLIEKQSENYRKKCQTSIEAMDKLKCLAKEMRDALLTNNLHDFGILLDKSWQAKKNMANGISTLQIDNLYEEVRKAGAVGGKITGAGGGGFMLFFCEPSRKFAVQEVLKKRGNQVVDFTFTQKGVMSWSIKE